MHQCVISGKRDGRGSTRMIYCICAGEERSLHLPSMKGGSVVENQCFRAANNPMVIFNFYRQAAHRQSFTSWQLPIINRQMKNNLRLCDSIVIISVETKRISQISGETIKSDSVCGSGVGIGTA
jgi:hypothetical protein